MAGIPITDGEFTMGKAGRKDVLLFRGVNGGGGEPARGTCEFLVTLKGERRVSGGSQPASHASFDPREGDELSGEREEALRAALSGMGVNEDAVKSRTRPAP